MMRQYLILTMFVTCLFGATQYLCADVHVRTDKQYYLPGEQIRISIVYANTTDTTQTLIFSTDCQIDYRIDQLSCLGDSGYYCTQAFTYVRVAPHDSTIWNDTYVCSVANGRHLLTAWVAGYGESWTMFEVGGTDSFTLSLATGWNFVSLPVRVKDNRVSSLFPSARPFAYRYNGGNYEITETMESGKGYWIKLTGAAAASISGTDYLEDTLDVSAGWNMIGALSIPILRSSIRSIPDSILTHIFTFDPRMPYGLDTYILPGQAYFVKVKSAGKLILKAE